MIFDCYKEGKYEFFVSLARKLFEHVHYNIIETLIHNYPKDAKTKEGLPFWQGTHKYPQSVTFDPQDPIHVSWLQAAANILGNIFGIPYCTDLNLIK